MQNRSIIDVQRKLVSIMDAIEIQRNLLAQNSVPNKILSKSSNELRKLANLLSSVGNEIDPVSQPEDITDPHNVKNLTFKTLMAFTAGGKKPLCKLSEFYGSGVYALYYHGKLDFYRPLAGSETPIYVGKTDPVTMSNIATEQGPRLFNRLKKHKSNISKTALDIADFEYRYMTIGDSGQTASEKILIDFFKPVWNNESGVLSGFGKNGDSATTRANKRSLWDVLHPGRKWAAESENTTSPDMLKEAVSAHLIAQPIYATLQDVISAARGSGGFSFID